MISRVAGLASIVLALLSLAIVVRLATGSDSDWLVGIIVAAPLVLLAGALAVIAYSTGRSEVRGE